jgi:hypothetical protein
MASRRWLEANAKRLKKTSPLPPTTMTTENSSPSSPPPPPPSLCWDVEGSPSAYATAGYRPHRYCFEPGNEEKTSRIRWTRFLYFDARPECGGGGANSSSSSSSTLFAPRSFAPQQREAARLDPLCKHDHRSDGGSSVLLSSYERALAAGKTRGEAVAAAAEAKAALARRAREGSERSREFLATSARKESRGVSDTNSDPVVWSEQLLALGEAVGQAMG